MVGRPVILVVTDDEEQGSLLVADLSRRLAVDYDVSSTGSTTSHGTLQGLAEQDRPVAAVIAAVELPAAATSGVALLQTVRKRHRSARRILLVDRASWRGHPVREAMILGQADSYLFHPWYPREEWLYFPMGEYLADYKRSQPPEVTVITIIGPRDDVRSHELRDTFARAGIPFEFHAAGSAHGRAMLAAVDNDGSRLPVVIFFSGEVLTRPTDADVAETLGFLSSADGRSCDVLIVGGGPSGLSAAVYAASEGLTTILIEPGVPGGQAGTSSMIRNYLGFPRGIAGAELTNRALEQAWLLGTEVVLAQTAVGLSADGDDRIITTADGSRIRARAVVLATGVSWRRIDVPRLEALIGSGVFYGSAGTEADALAGRNVFVLGGGNSAGQAAVHLATRAARVTLLIRREDLSSTMSDYLIREIEADPTIDVRTRVQVVDGSGEGRLRTLTLQDRRTGAVETVPADALFVMIGGEPRTDWLAGAVARDEAGFVVTGADVPGPAGSAASRPPLFLETSLPGVFAVGDVRHGATPRVASSVGSGAVAVQLVHEYLASLGRARDDASR